jgi:poly-gamma-glutamate capsule biosynthesis protein CapA/YwtB (metallophosphatase superfamily)
LSGEDQANAVQPPLVSASNTGTGNAVKGPSDESAAAAAGNDKVKGTVDAASNGGAKPTVKLSFVGDVIFASNVEDLLKKNGWDYPYRYVQEYLSKADITVANLETPISTRGTAQSKQYVYRSLPEALPSFKAAGFDLVNTANNHILDYGQDALLDTLDELDKAGIKRTGTGRNMEEAYLPVIMQQNGVKVAFLGFSDVVPAVSWFAGKQKPGLAESKSVKLALEAITKAREQADLVVVLAHWGLERTDRPIAAQTDLAHKYIDQGADLVVASHPHVLQGFEQYQGKWIAYSLGNFIFTTNDEPNTWESMILNASCTKDRACELQMMPIITKWAQPVRMPDEDGAKLLDKMTRISYNAKLETDGSVIVGPPAPARAPSAPAADPPAKKAAEKTEEKPAQKAAGKPGDKPPEKANDKATDKTADSKATDKPANSKTTDKTANSKAADQTAEKASDKTADKQTGKSTQTPLAKPQQNESHSQTHTPTQPSPHPAGPAAE